MSWSIDYLRRMSAFVTLPSAMRLRGAVLREEKGMSRDQLLTVRVTKPFRAKISLRERGTDCSTFREVVLNEIYEMIVGKIENCEYALDLGGNIGLTSLYISSRYPNARILTVEPSPENQAMLATNLAVLVQGGRCQVCEGAAWSADELLDLGTTPEGGGFDAIQVTEHTSTSTSRMVKGYTIPSLMKLAGFPRIDILKIDIEGAEEALFKGDCAWLEKVNGIAIEFHGTSRTDSGFDEVVAKHGFIVENDKYPNCVIAYRPSGMRVA